MRAQSEILHFRTSLHSPTLCENNEEKQTNTVLCLTFFARCETDKPTTTLNNNIRCELLNAFCWGSVQYSLSNL